MRGGQQGARGLPRLGLARRGALVREVYGAHPQATELRRQRGRERQPFEPALDVVPVRAKRLRRDGSAHQQPHALAGLVGGAPSQAMWAKTHPRDQALPVACSTSAASIARPEVLPPLAGLLEQQDRDVFRGDDGGHGAGRRRGSSMAPGSVPEGGAGRGPTCQSPVRPPQPGALATQARCRRPRPSGTVALGGRSVACPSFHSHWEQVTSWPCAICLPRSLCRSALA